MGCEMNCVATVAVKKRYIGQWSDRRRVVLLAITDSRGTQDKQLTVPDEEKLVSIILLQQSQ